MLYRKASGPYSDNLNNPILKGRFGCWTCTVIRKDHAMNNLINNGYECMLPLFDYRNWLANIRDDSYYRCKYRRNGTKALGPFTLEARKLLLDRLLKTQDLSNIKIIEEQEISFIKKMWAEDKKSSNYREK